MATDPVCGMFVDERTAQLTLVRENRVFYFCAESCLAQFAAPEAHRRRLWHRLAVAWPASIAVVVLVYVAQFPGSLYLELGLAAVVQFYAGWGFYRGARDAAIGRVWNMDVLVAVATSAAFLYSAAVLFLPGRLPSALYFDASSLIVTLILTGNYLELRTRERAGAARRKLAELVPREALLLEGGGERSIPLMEVQVGQRLRVRSAERIPVDGIVRSGRSSVDESWIAGESRPVDKAIGDPVVAGSLNLDGMLELEAVRVGDTTFLSEVGRLLDEAELGQVPLRKTADRIAERFVPAVLAIALASAAVWWLLGAGATIALLVFVTVAITACPCAFGIATPAALSVAVSQAADYGILFRGRDSLEQAAIVDVVVADKTGTLTEGRPRLTDVAVGEGWTESEVLALAAGVEAGSTHPLSAAVRQAALERGVAAQGIENPRVEPGVGASGMFQGHAIAVRRPTADEWSHVPAGLATAGKRFEAEGKGCSLVTVGAECVGVFAFDDVVRARMPEAIAALREVSIEVVLATGDNAGAADRVAASLGIRTVHARMTPAGKLALVRELQRAGHHVAFVGDGINDAPALSAADLGIAVAAGTDVAQEAGKVILVRSGFEAVPAVLETGRQALRKVRQNLRWAIGYNAILIPVAAGGLVPLWGLGIYALLPVAGALAMGLSSTTVVLNSLSLRVRSPPTLTAPAASLRVGLPGA